MRWKSSSDAAAPSAIPWGVRGAVLLLMVTACFTPSPPAEVPCDPDSPACPTGQRCVRGIDGYVCSTGDGLAPGDAPLANADAEIDGPPPPTAIQKTYAATVAECIAPNFPNPALCRQYNGMNQLVIDTRDSTTLDPWNSYIRFETDNAIAGKTVTKVVLRVVATNDAKAPGPDTGSVFVVSPFTLQSLTGTTPTKVGGQLAGTQGTVTMGKVISWTLPTSVVTPGQPVYLGLFANDDDGVNYFNIDGTTPPRLIVDAQ